MLCNKMILTTCVSILCTLVAAQVKSKHYRKRGKFCWAKVSQLIKTIYHKTFVA